MKFRVAGVIGAFTLFIYFAVAMVIYTDFSKFDISITLLTLKNNLPTQFKDIAATVGSIFSTLIGSIGIVLGYFYYKEKVENDRREVNIKKTANAVTELLKLVQSLRRLIEKIHQKGFTEDIQLNEIRVQIQEHFDQINLLLEINQKLFDLSSISMKLITSHYSIIEKSDLFMRLTVKALKKEPTMAVWESFKDKNDEVVKLLYMKLAEA